MKNDLEKTTVTDQIDGLIFDIPNKLEIWKLIDKLVEEEKDEITNWILENDFMPRSKTDWCRYENGDIVTYTSNDLVRVYNKRNHEKRN